ncbi:MAG: pyridoxal phosphate-dependent aminotransferase [Rhodobacteraceae bacterium]|nr:pyridoxal phosphate-dependent aminotransferase [Paracoccaceae bacterium]
MNLDEVIDRRNTHSAKWDLIEKIYQVPKQDGIAMWVADMDFRPPQAAYDALEKMQNFGIFGYYGDDDSYHQAIIDWMHKRHGWSVKPHWIFSTHGLVNGTALCVETFSEPGDGVVLFTPVYHAFSRVINAADRHVIECPLKLVEGIYKFDFQTYSQLLGNSAKMVILCSPHNPGGRVWQHEELKELADFCQQHNLLIVSDEIHHDLVFSDHKHIPMPLAVPSIRDRLIMLTATTKTFNLAGAHIGNVIIENPELRAMFRKKMTALGLTPNSFGLFLAESVYSDAGAEWLDNLMQYLNQNRIEFDTAMKDIPGVNSMPLEATYLAWVDFRETGLSDEAVTKRLHHQARLATNLGATFGNGGENFHRFNFATPRSVLREAIERIKVAFADLS